MDQPKLPFEHIEVAGSEALATWERLKAEKRGWPVIVGDENALETLAGCCEEAEPIELILAAASKLSGPQSIFALRDEQKREFRTYLAANDPEALAASEEEDRAATAPDGEWPTEPPTSTGLTVAHDLTGQPLARVQIVILPTADGSEAPAYLRWGGWNRCPPPEHHVAMLRSWRERYGAELVGMGPDFLNLRVARRPAEREEAMALARELYVYCADIVDQGIGALRPLAATLMADDWWFFWWD